MTARSLTSLFLAGLVAAWLPASAVAQEVPQPQPRPEQPAPRQAAPRQAPNPAPLRQSDPKRRIPPGGALAILIKNTLIAFNQGNLTGNYTVFRDLVAPEFREGTSPTRLADFFADMRDREIDISPVVLFEPKLVKPPEIDQDGDLILEGFFDTRPEIVTFFLVYRFVQGAWKLFAIKVDTVVAKEDAPAPSGPVPNPPIALEPRDLTPPESGSDDFAGQGAQPEASPRAAENGPEAEIGETIMDRAVAFTNEKPWIVFGVAVIVVALLAELALWNWMRRRQRRRPTRREPPSARGRQQTFDDIPSDEDMLVEALRRESLPPR